jgi:hypothetical protein
MLKFNILLRFLFSILVACKSAGKQQRTNKQEATTQQESSEALPQR